MLPLHVLAPVWHFAAHPVSSLLKDSTQLIGLSLSAGIHHASALANATAAHAATAEALLASPPAATMLPGVSPTEAALGAKLMKIMAGGAATATHDAFRTLAIASRMVGYL